MYQKIIIVGHLGRDPETRFNPKTGAPVTCFSVAANRKYKNAAEEVIEETIWFRVSTWGRQAEVCMQYLRKGRMVLVEGRLFFDRATGGPRVFTRDDKSVGASFEVSAETVRFLDKNGQEEGAVHADPGGPEEPQPLPLDEEEIPF
jgi:single-strand DNA-binding protein